MIDFGNELSISSVTISTAFGHYGRGLFPYYFRPDYRDLLEFVRKKQISIFAKSSTFNPRVGNFVLHKPWTWRFIKRLPDSTSMLNAYGLTNKGSEHAAKEIAKARREGFSVIPSFYPEFDKGDAVAVGEILATIRDFTKEFGEAGWILELNYSCPNSEEKIAQNVQSASYCTKMVKTYYPGLVVIAKSSILHPKEFYARQEDAGADCIHAINTIPWSILFDKSSPLADVGGGGVSGALAWQKSSEYIWQVPKWTSLPVIFGCGITNRENVEFCFKNGAKAISVCTWALFEPQEVRNCFRQKLLSDKVFNSGDVLFERMRA